MESRVGTKGVLALPAGSEEATGSSPPPGRRSVGSWCRHGAKELAPGAVPWPPSRRARAPHAADGRVRREPPAPRTVPRRFGGFSGADRNGSPGRIGAWKLAGSATGLPRMRKARRWRRSSQGSPVTGSEEACIEEKRGGGAE